MSKEQILTLIKQYEKLADHGRKYNQGIVVANAEKEIDKLKVSLKEVENGKSN